MDVVGRLRAALLPRRDIRVALLFGSEARKTARPDSDVDVAVLAPGVDRLALAAALSDAVAREVQVVDLSDPPLPLLEEIVRDGVVLGEAQPGVAALWRSHALTTLETDRPWYARMQVAWLRRVAERGVL